MAVGTNGGAGRREPEDRGVPRFVHLAGGRRICYLEKGASRAEARHALLVLHGVGSSRLSNMPGVSHALLREYGIRLVAIDRPGYGLSDPAPKLTLHSFTQDIEAIADKLELGPKFWLLGYSGGGAYSWAAARWIPHRLAGVALWAPVGHFGWKGLSPAEVDEMHLQLTRDNRLLRGFNRFLPPWLIRFAVRHYVVPGAGQAWLERCRKNMSPPDARHLARPEMAEMMVKDSLESLARGGLGQGLAKVNRVHTTASRSEDVELFPRSWGFELDELKQSFGGPIHIWQGSEDWLVPIGIQRWVASQLPGLVHLHELPGEGHLSWFCYNEKNHRIVLDTCFGNRAKGVGTVQHEDVRQGRRASQQHSTEGQAVFLQSSL